MISKIKGLFESEQKIAEIHDKLTQHNESFSQQQEIIRALGENILNLKTNFENLHNETGNYIGQIKNDIAGISSLKQQINDELNDLKLLKTHIKQKLVDELVQEFKTELRANTERIKTDIKSYNDLKQSLSSMTIQLNEIKADIEKFTRISRHIKETDFSLEKHAKKLGEFNEEKLKLLQEIESLQKLIGRERRKGY